MKIKYYFTNNKEEKILARTSTNEYKYALIFRDNLVIKCSINKETIEQEFMYMTKGFGHKFDEKVNGKHLYSNQFYNPSDLKIVELEKEMK